MGEKGEKTGGGLEAIRLIQPRLECGGSLAKALRARRTVREFSDRPLSPRTLSDLLWAACGINRLDGPFGVAGRTAASASNSQEIDVYVALGGGTYLYDPAPHCLVPIAAGDLRRFALGAGQGAGGSNAPVRLIYVADIGKLEDTAGYEEPGLHDPEVQKSYYYVDTGLIAGNVYLFAASRGLAAWFHNCDRAALSEKLGLPDGQRPLFGQTIGYPARSEP
jgi:nitroreductase